MSGLTFYQSIESIDIWFDTDTRAGKTVYQFWFQGKAYERDTEKEIKDLARNNLATRFVPRWHTGRATVCYIWGGASKILRIVATPPRHKTEIIFYIIPG